jgi:acetyl esterase/lipase
MAPSTTLQDTLWKLSPFAASAILFTLQPRLRYASRKKAKAFYSQIVSNQPSQAKRVDEYAVRSRVPATVVNVIRRATQFLPPAVLKQMFNLTGILLHPVFHLSTPLDRARLGNSRAYFLGDPLPDHPSHTDVVLVYIHGGGFVFEDGMYLPFAAHVTPRLRAAGLNAHVLVIPYLDMAPDIFPGAIERIKSTVESLNIPMSRVVMVGDSAGGNLLLTTVPRMATHPAGVCVVSPWCDLDNRETGSIVSNADSDIIHMELLKAGAACYCRGELVDSRRSPSCMVDVSCFKETPMLFLAGTAEIFYSQIKAFFDKLGGNTNARLVKVTGGVHVQQLLPLWVDEEGLDRIARFCLECFNN